MGENTITMIITLGKRDVTLDGKVFDSIEYSEEYEDLKEGFRDNHGKRTLSQRYGGVIIHKSYDKYADRLGFPIVDHMIKYVLDCEQQIDKLYIVVTDQDDDKHKNNDTVYFGEIIKTHLDKKFKYAVKGKEFKIIKEDVADLGGTNDQFEKFYDKKFKEVSDNDKLYIANNGGIDAINTAVLINGIMRFKTNCINLYLNEDKKNVHPIHFVNSFVLEVEKDKLKKLLENYDYVAALNIVSFNKELEKFKALIEIAKNRLYFNLDECKKIEIDYYSQISKKDYIAREVDTALSEINEIEQNKLASIQELYINCRIKYFQEQYVDFLLRIFRLEEAIARRTVEEYIIYASTNNDDKFSAMTKKINENKYLESYLDSCEDKNDELHWRNNCNIKILKEIIKFALMENKAANGETLINDGKIYQEVGKVLELMDCLDCLSQLRNKSIGAHGFKGVSKAKIESELKNKCDKDIDYIFGIIENLINKKFQDSWYDKVNNTIISNLKN